MQCNRLLLNSGHRRRHHHRRRRIDRHIDGRGYCLVTKAVTRVRSDNVGLGPTNGQAGSFLNAVTLTFTVPTGDIYTTPAVKLASTVGSFVLANVSYANGIYAITTNSTTAIKNGDTLTITAYDDAFLSA